MDKLVLVGDSWCQGVWSLHKDNELVISHPGMSELLSKKNYNVVNLGRGGSSLWQILYSISSYLRTPQLSGDNLKFIVFQADPAIDQQSSTFSVDFKKLFHDSSDINDFYFRALDIFYIKLNQIAEQYNIKIYLVGAVSDLNLELLTKINNFPNLIIMCESWIKLLDPQHTVSMIPLHIESTFLENAIKYQREDFCDKIVSISDTNFIKLQIQLETEYFGDVLGDYHPNLKGHTVMAEYIDNFLNKENNA